MMQRADQSDAVRLRQATKKPCSDQRAAREAETHRHLLHRAGNSAGHAGIGLLNVGICHRVHAGELQRIEEALREAEQNDECNRR